MRERDHQRCRDRLELLAGATLGAHEARLEAIAVLRRAVAFERWCWPLTDPSSLLSVSGIAEFDLWPALPRLAALEQHGDVTTKPQLARAARASVALSEATGGDLARSARWRECLRPYGVGDELMTVCRDRHGWWGTVELMRDSDAPAFAEDDAALLDELAPVLGRLLRRSQARPDAAGHVEPLPPATLILDAELRPTSWTPSAAGWLAELGPAPDVLPPAVFEIGARARAPKHDATLLPASVRIRTPTGRWAVLEGGPLEGAAGGSVAITIRGACDDEIYDLLCRIYDLSPRERQLDRPDAPRPGHRPARRGPVHLPPHRAGPPQGDLRQDRPSQPPRIALPPAGSAPHPAERRRASRAAARLISAARRQRHGFVHLRGEPSAGLEPATPSLPSGSGGSAALRSPCKPQWFAVWTWQHCTGLKWGRGPAN